MNKHLWVKINSNSPLTIFTCQNCQGVKVTDYQGKFHYFYRGRTQHC